MKVELITSTPEHIISDMAKVCYGTKHDKDLTYSLVNKHKHLAVLRFAFAVIAVDDISIACQNQLVRSKHLDFLVESKRYVKASKGNFTFIMPDNLTPENKTLMNMVFSECMTTYQDLIDSGVKPEDARAVLPMNTSTKVRIAGNLQSWKDFIKLRLNDKAQKEIRHLAKEINNILAKEYPNVFKEHIDGKVNK